jgi:sugar phosphate isomerase/epimerase
MRFSVQTSLLPGVSLDEKFVAAKEAGFDAVEVNIGPRFDLAENLDGIRQAMSVSGLPVSGICTHDMHDPLQPNAEERTVRFAGLARLLELADEIGAAGVVSVPVRPPGQIPQDVNAIEWAAGIYRAWAESLPSGNSAVFLEPLNRYEAQFLRRVGQAVDLAERIGSPRVLALADLFHMNIEEASMSEPILAAGAQLGYVHIADNNRLQPGAGCLDMRSTFEALKQIGYSGYISIECSALGGPLATQGDLAMLTESARYLRDVWSIA